MGQAKVRAKKRETNARFVKTISRARFDLYTIGTRKAAARLFSEEVSYWSSLDETVLGMVFWDRTDQDFMWMVIARDRVGRFRCIEVSRCYDRVQVATDEILEKIAEIVQTGNIRELGSQNDEPNTPVDLLRVRPGTDPATLHPFFHILLESPARLSARAVMKEVGPWLAPSDPHFVSEFQFKNFDQRLWELYLWAAFRELGFDIEQPEAPDFLCSTPGIEFSVEATTVAKSIDGALAVHPNPETPEEMKEFLANYMAMKFGSSLTSKLNKKNAKGQSYWDRPSTSKRPFILAIADFHKPGDEAEPGSMVYSHSALAPYLYGTRIMREVVDGQLIVQASKNAEHRYDDKVIPSGFFDLPGAENISAVLFSNAGTLAKFDRMGIAAGFIAPKHSFSRMGVRYNSDPNATAGIPFFEDVCGEGYREYWSDELQLFHNPNARIPLSEDIFGGITQHFFRDGDHVSITFEGAVIESRTIISPFFGDEKEGSGQDQAS